MAGEYPADPRSWHGRAPTTPAATPEAQWGRSDLLSQTGQATALVQASLPGHIPASFRIYLDEHVEPGTLPSGLVVFTIIYGCGGVNREIQVMPGGFTLAAESIQVRAQLVAAPAPPAIGVRVQAFLALTGAALTI